jgi:hypothetical protein
MDVSNNDSNRTVAILNERELSRLFPGVPPNTQIRIMGPVGISMGSDHISDLEDDYDETEDDEHPILSIHPNASGLFENSNVSANFIASSNEQQQSDRNEAKSVNMFAPLERSPTVSFSEAQFLERISGIMEQVISSDVKMWGGNTDMQVTISGSGPHRGLKQVTMKNIVFEVNRLVVNRVVIGQLAPLPRNGDNKFMALISYVRNNKNFYTGPAWTIEHSGKTVAEAMAKVYQNLKAINRCAWCDAVWDTRMSKECVVCIVSDFFTRENEEIECPACTEKVKDFTTLDCRHRMCYKCMFRLVKPRKCPLCRCEID